MSARKEPSFKDLAFDWANKNPGWMVVIIVASYFGHAPLLDFYRNYAHPEERITRSKVLENTEELKKEMSSLKVELQSFVRQNVVEHDDLQDQIDDLASGRHRHRRRVSSTTDSTGGSLAQSPHQGGF